MGAGIECDVRLSGSQSAVVFHDSSLKRMCGVALEVEQTPAASLTGQRLLESSQYIPALSEVLELVAARAPLLIEMKTRERNVAALCSEVMHDLAPWDVGRVGVMSFDPQVGCWFRQHVPHVRRGLVIGHDLPWLKRRLALFLAAPHFLAVDQRALRNLWVVEARKRMPVYCWTIRTAAERAQATVQADALIWEADGRPRI